MKLNAPKFTTFILIIVWSFVSCRKDNNPISDNSEKYRLVKKLNYSSSTSANPVEGVERVYNEAGNMVKELFYLYRLTTVCWQYREYEYSGNQKKKMKVFEENEDEVFMLDWYVDYFYEGDRLTKEEYRLPDGSLLNTKNYQYSNENLIRKYLQYSDGEISEEMKYTYDSQNRLTLEENSESDVDKYRYTKHIYDDSGRKIKLEYYNVNLNLLKYVEMGYNGRSKLSVRDLHYDKNGTQILQYEHNYDKLGNLTETVLSGFCSLFKRKYDGGLLIEEILYWDPFEEDESEEKIGCAEKGMSRYEYEKFE